MNTQTSWEILKIIFTNIFRLEFQNLDYCKYILQGLFKNF